MTHYVTYVSTGTLNSTHLRTRAYRQSIHFCELNWGTLLNSVWDVAPAWALWSVGRWSEVDEGEVYLLSRLNFDDPRRLWTATSGVCRQETRQQWRSRVTLARHVATAVGRRQYCAPVRKKINRILNLQYTAHFRCCKTFFHTLKVGNMYLIEKTDMMCCPRKDIITTKTSKNIVHVLWRAVVWRSFC